MQPRDYGPILGHDMARRGPRRDRQVLLIPARIIAIPGLGWGQVDTAAPEQEADDALVAGPGDTRLEVVHDSQGLGEGLEAVPARVYRAFLSLGASESVLSEKGFDHVLERGRK